MIKMKKRGQIWDNLIPWIIGLIAFALIVTVLVTISSGQNSIVDWFGNLWRFGR